MLTWGGGKYRFTTNGYLNVQNRRMEWKRELTEEEETILKQAIEDSILVPKNGKVKELLSIAPYLPNNRSALIFALQRLNSELFLRRFIQWLINISFSVTLNVYFKLFGMRLEDAVHIFSHFFTYYDMQYVNAEKEEKYVKKYEKNTKFLSAVDF